MLAFWSNQSGSWRLYMVGRDSADPTELTTYENPGSSPSRAVWSPDGESILIGAASRYYFQLFTLQLDSLVVTRHEITGELLCSGLVKKN